MKQILLTLSIASLLVFSACTEEQDKSPVAPKSDATTTEKSASAPNALLSTPKAALPADAGNAMSQIKEVSGFSDTLNSTWNSIKGMDYSDKSAFVAKGMSLVSAAKDQISSLKGVSSLLSSDMGKQLMSKVGSLSGSLGGLSGLLGKSGTITSSDWGSYKDQIGSAIGGLAKGFSGLGSL